jgi:hypothetical protein
MGPTQIKGSAPLKIFEDSFYMCPWVKMQALKNCPGFTCQKINKKFVMASFLVRKGGIEYHNLHPPAGKKLMKLKQKAI